MLLQEYNARLAAEQDDRKVAQRMLTDYMACQKYELALASEKLEVNKFEAIYWTHHLMATSLWYRVNFRLVFCINILRRGGANKVAIL